MLLLIMLTGIRIDHDEVDMCNIERYTLYTKCDNSNIAWRVYTWEYLLKIFIYLKPLPWTLESVVCLQVKCKTRGIGFVVLAVCRHWQSDVNKILQQFKLKIELLLCKGIKCLIRYRIRNIGFFMAFYGFEYSVGESTKMSINSSSCLDHTYVGTINKSSDKANVLHLAITDHSWIYLTITGHVSFQDGMGRGGVQRYYYKLWVINYLLGGGGSGSSHRQWIVDLIFLLIIYYNNN